MQNKEFKVLLFKLLGTAVCMFLFALFVMPPLYNMFCEVTGIGGKTGGPYQVTDASVDTSRTVTVQLLGTTNGAMPWEFHPKQYEVKVHPGALTKVEFYARNGTSRDMVAQAIPNLTPFNAADFLHKTECFCFHQQPLKAGQEADLPIVFVVDKDLPKAVTTITLAYTLFDITDRVGDSLAKK